MRNVSDKKNVTDGNRKAKDARREELRDLEFVLSSREGRRFVWKLLEMCGVFTSSFTGNSQTFFLEGQRNIGLKVLADVNEASLEKYVVMMKEAKGDSDV